MANNEDNDENEIEGAKTAEELVTIHTDAIARMNRIQTIYREVRQQCLDDRRFYSISGAMWEDNLGKQYENKPKIEVNKIMLSTIRIFNEYRNNRITVNFIPSDGSKAGTLSDACNGLYRADEQDSLAEEAYDNAFEEGTGGGIGAWRLRNDYCDEESEDDETQRIYIEPIFDADSSVFFDPDAKRQDKADAKYCFVISSMTRDAFKEEYSEASEPQAPKGKTGSSVPKNVTSAQFDWATPDVIYIAEYYVEEKESYTSVKFKSLTGNIEKVDKDELDEKEEGKEITLRQKLKATGYTKVGEKQVKRKRIHKYIISGDEVLQDLGYIAGTNIPIVPYYGKRWFIDNVERCMGHVRLAKDPQRLKNMQVSKLAEIAALSTVEKPILTPEQIAGHQDMWSRDNIENYPYLLVNPITDATGATTAIGPQSYTKSAQLPAALVGLLQATEQDMKDILGNQEAGEVIQPNSSGVAVELVQAKLDMQTFIYISNMAKAVKRSGEIWLGMAKEIYVEEGRKLKVVDETGEASQITLNGSGVDPNTQIAGKVNDITKAIFDVVATPGPTSASKKAATARNLINLLQIAQQDPETMQVLISMIMTNIEGEGIAEVREYFRNKLLMMGVAKPNNEEAEQLAKLKAEKAQQPPDANTQLVMAAAEEAQTNALKNKATVVKTAADAEKAKAETLKILEELHTDKTASVLSVFERLQQLAINGAAMPPGDAQATPEPVAPPQDTSHIVQIPG